MLPFRQRRPCPCLQRVKRQTQDVARIKVSACTPPRRSFITMSFVVGEVVQMRAHGSSCPVKPQSCFVCSNGRNISNARWVSMYRLGKLFPRVRNRTKNIADVRFMSLQR